MWGNLKKLAIHFTLPTNFSWLNNYNSFFPAEISIEFDELSYTVKEEAISIQICAILGDFTGTIETAIWVGITSQAGSADGE